MSGVEQQPCCCDNLHPCCASWDGPSLCQYDPFGTSVACEPPLDPPPPTAGPGKKLFGKGCFNSEQECREHFSASAGVPVSVTFYADEPCPNEWPEDFCVEAECTTPCLTFACGQCGPYVAACTLIPCGEECDEGTIECEPAACCDPEPVKYCCCISGETCNFIANCTPAAIVDGVATCTGEGDCSLVDDCEDCVSQYNGALGCCRSCNGVTFINGNFFDTECSCFPCDDPAFPDGYAEACTNPALGGNPLNCWTTAGPCNYSQNAPAASNNYAGKDERKGYIVTENGAVPNTLFLFGYGVQNLQ